MWGSIAVDLNLFEYFWIMLVLPQRHDWEHFLLRRAFLGHFFWESGICMVSDYNESTNSETPPLTGFVEEVEEQS
jgi:hypothetical protein